MFSAALPGSWPSFRCACACTAVLAESRETWPEIGPGPSWPSLAAVSGRLGVAGCLPWGSWRAPPPAEQEGEECSFSSLTLVLLIRGMWAMRLNKYLEALLSLARALPPKTVRKPQGFGYSFVAGRFLIASGPETGSRGVTPQADDAWHSAIQAVMKHFGFRRPTAQRPGTNTTLSRDRFFSASSLSKGRLYFFGSLPGARAAIH